jgi:hypothetical protein
MLEPTSGFFIMPDASKSSSTFPGTEAGISGQFKAFNSPGFSGEFLSINPYDNLQEPSSES